MFRLRQNKYRAKPITIDGIWFASQKEGKRYKELKLLEKAGQIYELKRQIDFSFDLYDVHICTYRADFVYLEHDKDGSAKLVVEDAKGFKTPDYKIKKKLLKALYGYEVRET